jgi:hypothetical protein
MNRATTTLLAILAISLLPAFGAGKPVLQVGPASDGERDLVVVAATADGTRKVMLGQTRSGQVDATGSGLIPGRLQWITWTEDSAPYFAVSNDGGSSWSDPRQYRKALQLKDRDLMPGDPMPQPELPMPASGQLFMVQGRLPWQPAMHMEIEAHGCEPVSYIHHQAWLTRCSSPASAGEIGRLGFVQRVEPYSCSMRLAPDLLEWIRSPATDDQEVMAINAITVRPDSRYALAGFARGIGVDVAPRDSGGSLLALDVTRDQLLRLACHDGLQYVDRRQTPQVFMDIARADSGADWTGEPMNGGYCGAGVRGEILDNGFDTDHQEYAGRMIVHGTVNLETHGTSTFGSVFADGSVDPQARGLLPCGTGIAGDYDEVWCDGCSRFDYTRDSRDLFQASFQSNSWAMGSGPEYSTISYEMEEIAWRLDMAFLQAMNNDGKDNPGHSAYEGWAKNVISIGATHHQDTLDSTDDWWCSHDCRNLYLGDPAGCETDPHCEIFINSCYDIWFCANIGPAPDGRIKPDLVYWFDMIYTTTTDPATGEDGYKATFGGTSAATPLSAGVLGLILEMWADTAVNGRNPWGRNPAGASVFEKQPHASTLKALMINSAEQYPFSGAGHDLGRNRQGWGRPNARNALEGAAVSHVVDESELLQNGESRSWTLEVLPGEPDLKATLAWLDPPKTLATGGKELINDLDLRLVSPADGTGDVDVYCGNIGLDTATVSTAAWSGPAAQAPDCDDPVIAANRDELNNVENVFVHEQIPGQGITAGLWTVDVTAYAVNTDGNPNDTCRDIDLDPSDPQAGQADCEFAGCQWDSVRGVCGDFIFDQAFGLVVTGGQEPHPGASDRLLIAKDTGGSLALSWQPDCGRGTSYGIYRGDLGSGYSSIAPEPGMCAVTGSTATVPAGTGSADFFLIVPNNGNAEGSYGVGSDGAARPVAAGSCRPQGVTHSCAP